MSASKAPSTKSAQRPTMAQLNEAGHTPSCDLPLEELVQSSLSDHRQEPPRKLQPLTPPTWQRSTRSTCARSGRSQPPHFLTPRPRGGSPAAAWPTGRGPERCHRRRWRRPGPPRGQIRCMQARCRFGTVGSCCLQARALKSRLEISPWPLCARCPTLGSERVKVKQLQETKREAVHNSITVPASPNGGTSTAPPYLRKGAPLSAATSGSTPRSRRRTTSLASSPASGLPCCMNE